jgi:regulator of sigma E protease
MLLAINWSTAGIQVFYLILSLSILVILHEFGHYITARWFKCRVEKFYLFFNPWFSIFKKKIGETEYGIGWLPLGGYVKISGMIDESMDKDALKLPPQPYEFRSKPAWQRLIIMLGGIIVNVLLAFLIYAMVLFIWGEKKVPVSSLKYGISFSDSSLMSQLTFQNGDNIVAIDGKPIEDYGDIIKQLVLVNHTVTVIRDSKELNITMPENFIGQLIEKKKNSNGLLFAPRVPVIVADVPDTSAGYKDGLRVMDHIIAVDSTQTPFMDEFKSYLGKHSGQYVNLIVDRGNKQDTLHALDRQDGTIGFIGVSDFDQLDSLGILKLEKKKYGFFAAFPAGVTGSLGDLKNYVGQFKKIASPKTGAYKGLGGFKTIGSVFPTQWGDWETFWRITAFLSIILAFMNLLPIPALDGGHVLFTLVEMITGRKPSDKFLEYAQIVGMVFLLSLMLYANGNDWFGWGRGR